MSDFDKEAERERLREKYERDEEKREVTERMSELLLKGATMTNAHCQDCGDPIFRYDGQEFCATCQKTVRRTGGGSEDDATGDGTTDGANGDREEIEVATPDETRVQFGGEEAPDPEADGAESADATGDAPRDARSQSAPTQTPPDRPQSTGAEPDGSGMANLRSAHASLSREIARLAQAAENCDDLGQERDLLAATREAAEALEAVRDAGR